MIKTTTKKKNQGVRMGMPARYEDDDENILKADIEPVSYEENQELLRAFGGQAL